MPRSVVSTAWAAAVSRVARARPTPRYPSARALSTGAAASRACRAGSTGMSRAETTNPMPPPISASMKREVFHGWAFVGGVRVAIRMAAEVLCMIRIGPPPATTAVVSARATTRPTCQAPVPISAISRSARRMPMALPTTSSVARRSRWASEMATVATAAIGAKKGLSWPIAEAAA